MAQLGLQWGELTHLALTHFHSDHCSDLPTLVFGWRYGMSPPRRSPISLLGPPGTAGMLQHFDRVFTLPLTSDEIRIDVTELAEQTAMEIGRGVVLECIRVPHTPESVAYSVSEGGRRVVFSGDTGLDRGFAEWARGADLLVLECSLPEALALPMHLTPQQCAEVAAIAQPARLVLTHFYPPVELVDMISIVRERYAGPVVLAYDGWSTTVGT
jgi:ribonuclease BN (tRNA processing enzyme)